MLILLMKEFIEKTIEVLGMEYKEIIYRSFTTEPRIRRINFGYTISSERCKNVMEHLWNMGLKELATYEVLENTVALCIGMDRRTIRRYIGFPITNRKNGATSWVKGYLERLGYIERVKNRNYLLNHFKVNRDYHCETVPLSATLTSRFVDESQKVAKEVMCVRLEERRSTEREEFEERKTFLASTIEKINNNNNNNTHTNRSSESTQKWVVEDGER